MEQRKEFKIPNTFVIVFVIIILVTILTYIIPAGIYEYLPGTDTIDPDSFHYIDRTPVSFWHMIESVSVGMRNSASIIFMILLVGGYFNVIVATGAIDSFASMLINRFGNRSLFILPVICILMALLGAAGVVANSVVAFIPLGMVLARKLKMDPLIALAMMLVSSYCGFGTSPMSASTVQIAQSLANIPLLSGFGFRAVGFLILFAITMVYIMHYAVKIVRNPSLSIMGEEWVLQEDEKSDSDFSIRHAGVLIALALGLGIYVWGSLKFNWSLIYLEGSMLITSIIVAALAGIGTEAYVKYFLEGVQQMCFSAIMVGCATAVSVIMKNGNILHTIIHGMAQILLLLPEWLEGPVMFYMNVFFNFFVPSGSGQASIVIPIMAPLSDVIGITRQMAICAYQYGDGLSNLVFPTNGTMMACIAIAGVKYDKWLKWMLPLFGIWLVQISIWMVIGTVIGI